jgi:hypothetical protein
VPSVDNFAINVAAAQLGAACPGVPSPWTTSVVMGANHALGWNFALAISAEDMRSEAIAHRGTVSPQIVSPRIVASPQSWLTGIAPTGLQQLEGTRAGGRAAKLLLTTALMTVTSKPNHINKTRTNAGGYGAMGPHLQRERLT